MRLTKIILLFLNNYQILQSDFRTPNGSFAIGLYKVIFNFPQNAYGYVVTSFSYKTDLKENNRRF